MAGKASPFACHGDMLHCHVRAFLVVTVQTKKVAFGNKKLRELRSVRLMTGGAHPVLERHMVNLPIRLQSGYVMAVEAEFASLFNGLKRFR